MAVLILLCHAATLATRLGRFPDDEPVEHDLDPLDPPPVHRTLRSPALCCAQTAAALGVVAPADDRLRDCDYGRWRGHAIEDVAAGEPDAVTEWLSVPSAAPHGGESLTDLIARVGAFMDAVADDRSSLAAVTHPAVIKAAMVHALGAGPEVFWRVDVPPLARISLHGNANRWTWRPGG